MSRAEKDGLQQRIDELQDSLEQKIDDIARLDTNNKYKVQECEALERKNR
jgi:hypothetical protein